MKLKPKTPTSPAAKATPVISRDKAFPGKVTISYSTEIKQSLDWQSLGGSLGITISCEDDSESIAATTDRARAFVDDTLVTIAEEQRKVLVMWAQQKAQG